MSRSRATLLQGTLDLLILKALATGELHGLGRVAPGRADDQGHVRRAARVALSRRSIGSRKPAGSPRNGKRRRTIGARSTTRSPGLDASSWARKRRSGTASRSPWRARSRPNTDDTDYADGFFTRPPSVIVMPMFARLSSLWRNLVHRDRVDRDLDDELAAVYQLLVDEKTRAGLTLEQARRQARLELGGVDPVKQRVREERSGALVETLVKDARYAFRMLRTNPGFTLRRRAVAGRRHRRQQRHLFGGECGDVAVAAGERLPSSFTSFESNRVCP